MILNLRLTESAVNGTDLNTNFLFHFQSLLFFNQDLVTFTKMINQIRIKNKLKYQIEIFPRFRENNKHFFQFVNYLHLYRSLRFYFTELLLFYKIILCYYFTKYRTFTFPHLFY